MKQYNVIAVVVTYNRKKLLIESLDALFDQTYPVSKVVLIDNASTDGTRDLLKARGYLDNVKVRYVFMEENIGGSGGFYKGLKLSTEYECDWIWLMDDDTIPTQTCLENLINANEIIMESHKENKFRSQRKTAFLASAIYGPEGEYMNLPEINKRPSTNGYAYWYEFLDKGIVNISWATFVSVLIKSEAVEKCGFPCRDYFIWGDDSEYTLRLSTYYGEGYFIGKSKAIHKRIGAKALSIYDETDIQRIERFHYFYRNNLITGIYYGLCNPVIKLTGAFWGVLKSIFDIKNFKYRKIILRGTLEGLVRYRHFKKYIDSQLNLNKVK